MKSLFTPRMFVVVLAAALLTAACYPPAGPASPTASGAPAGEAQAGAPGLWQVYDQ